MTRGDAYLDSVAELIVQHGWALQGVFQAEGQEAADTPFVYTVGLCTDDHPEIIVFGLSVQVAGALLNNLGRRITTEGLKIEPYQQLDKVVRNHPVIFLPVLNSSEHLTVANAMFGQDGPVEALQLVFPDTASRWPWDPGFELPKMRLLGPPPA